MTSVVTTISKAPAAWAAAAILVTSVAVPNRFGVCTTTQAVSLSIWARVSASPSTASGHASVAMPTAWARVSIVSR